MSLDRNEFFRQAVRRICGSLDIQRAMANCFHYIQAFLPMNELTLISRACKALLGRGEMKRITQSDEICKTRSGQWESSPIITGSGLAGSSVPQNLGSGQRQVGPESILEQVDRDCGRAGAKMTATIFWLSPSAPSISLLLPSKMQILPRFWPPFSGALRAITSTWLGPTPSPTRIYSEYKRGFVAMIAGQTVSSTPFCH
jgi:hypothetical protein